MTLRDPDVCRCGSTQTRVVKKRRKAGFHIRQHRCLCCGQSWLSYETLIDPRRIQIRPASSTNSPLV